MQRPRAAAASRRASTRWNSAWRRRNGAPHRLKPARRRRNAGRNSLEQRTANTERQTAQIAQHTAAPQTPIAPISALKLNGFNDLKLYGDVEFNLDGASRSGQPTSLKGSDHKDWKPGNKERWDINGRILVGLDGYRRNPTATSPASACNRWQT